MERIYNIRRNINDTVGVRLYRWPKIIGLYPWTRPSFINSVRHCIHHPPVTSESRRFYRTAAVTRVKLARNSFFLTFHCDPLYIFQRSSKFPESLEISNFCSMKQHLNCSGWLDAAFKCTVKQHLNVVSSRRQQVFDSDQIDFLQEVHYMEKDETEQRGTRKVYGFYSQLGRGEEGWNW